MNNEIVKEEIVAAEAAEEVAVEAVAEEVAEVVEEAVAEVAEEVAAEEASAEEVAEAAEEVTDKTAEVKAKVDAIVADALQKMDVSLNKMKALVQDKVQKLRDKMQSKEEASEDVAEEAAEVAEEVAVDAVAEEVSEEADIAEVAEELKKKGISLDDIKAVLAKEAAKAKAMIQDKEKMEKLAAKAQKLCEKLANLPVAGRYFRDIPTLCQIIRDYVTGKYKECPLATIIAVTVALLYLVNPFDLVPDAIPLLGVMDDVAAVTLVLEAARNDLESYRKWQAAQKTEENK